MEYKTSSYEETHMELNALRDPQKCRNDA